MHSFNTMFALNLDGERRVLRVGNACRIHPIGVEDVEAAWLADLASAGFGVPRNVAADDGSHWVRRSVPDVDVERLCSMFTWVAGRPVADRISAEALASAGALLAELHEHAAAGNTRIAVPAAVHADRVVYFHEEDRVSTHASAYGSLFEEAIDRVQRSIDDLWADPPHRPHLLHGDFGPHNVMSWRGRLAPIDFQDLLFGFDLQDVAITCSDLGRHHPDLVEPFKAGYRSVRSWPRLDPELAATLDAARSLNIMNLRLHLARFGVGAFLDDHGQRIAAWMEGS